MSLVKVHIVNWLWGMMDSSIIITTCPQKYTTTALAIYD